MEVGPIWAARFAAQLTLLLHLVAEAPRLAQREGYSYASEELHVSQ